MTRGERHGAGVRAVRLIALLVAPVLALCLTSSIQRAAGPRWTGTIHPDRPDRPPAYDPDYTYLLNSVNLAEGAAPRHTDHPGTTVQLLGAAVLAAHHAISPDAASLRKQVLADPEAACNLISNVLEGLFAVCLAIFGVAAARFTGSLAAAMFAQVLPVMSVAAMVSLYRVMPEPLVMSVSLLLAAALLRALRTPAPAATGFGATSGLLVAAGLATKITFLPVAIIPWAVMGVVQGWSGRSGRARAAHLGCLLAGLAAFLAPILPQFPRMLDWFGRLLVRDGRYGSSGGHFILNPATYLSNLWGLARSEPVAAVAIGLSLIVGLLLLRPPPSGAAPADRRTLTVFWALITADILQFLIVAKHPGPRYLTPVIALTGMNFCMLHALCPSLATIRRRAARAALAGGLGVACGVALVQVRWELAWMRADSPRHAAVYRAAEVAARDGSIVVYTYRSSSPAFALAFANTYTVGRFSADLSALHPRREFYVVGARRYWGIDSVGDARGLLPDEQVRDWAARGRLLFQCPPASRPRDFEYDELVPAAGAMPEGLYRARIPGT